MCELERPLVTRARSYSVRASSILASIVSWSKRFFVLFAVSANACYEQVPSTRKGKAFRTTVVQNLEIGDMVPRSFSMREAKLLSAAMLDGSIDRARLYSSSASRGSAHHDSKTYPKLLKAAGLSGSASTAMWKSCSASVLFPRTCIQKAAVSGQHVWNIATESLGTGTLVCSPIAHLRDKSSQLNEVASILRVELHSFLKRCKRRVSTTRC